MSIALALLKKETLAVFWKGLALTCIAIAIVFGAALLDSGGFHARSFVEALICALFCQVVFGSLFLSMHVTSAEQADGSIEFVRSLPVSLWKVGVVRILMAWVALLVPIAAAIGSTALLEWRYQIPPVQADDPHHLDAAFSIALCATNLFFWMNALAMNQRTEIRAGAIGLLVLVTGCVGLILANFTKGLIFFAPGGVLEWPNIIRIYPRLQNSITPWILMGIWFLVMNGLLLTVAVRRYGQEAGQSAESSVWSRNRLAIWAWFHLKQAWPLAAASTMVTALILFVQSNDSAADIAAPVTVLGIVWAIVAGVTLFITDLEPRLAGFWRSRPISPDGWFWTKFLLGLLMLMGFIELPLAASQLLGHTRYFILIALVHSIVYSLAVLCTCVVRQPIYAGIFSVCGTVAMFGITVMDARNMHVIVLTMRLIEDFGKPLNIIHFYGETPFVAACLGGMLALAVVFTLAARWCVVRDYRVL